MKKKQYSYYLQIDFIDRNGCANYINTFNINEFKEALKHYSILQDAQSCISNSTFYVLDLYRYELDKENQEIEDTDELIITIKSADAFSEIALAIREIFI